MNELQEKTESALFRDLEQLNKKFENDIAQRTLVYEELVEIFHQYMPHLLKYSPLNLYINPLSNFIRHYMGEEVPGCITEEFSKYEEKADFKQDMEELIAYYKGLIAENAILNPLEFTELSKLALVDEENSQMFTKFLLGQIISGNNFSKKQNTNLLITNYCDKFLQNNGLYCRKCTVANSEISKHFQNRIISTLYKMFYGVWNSIQKSEDYNESSIINIIKIDEYFRTLYGETYYEENSDVYSCEANCHLNATLLLADFLQEASPTTFHQHRDWLIQRTEYYTDLLYDRNRTFKGSKYDIDELFAQTLEYTGEKKEDILGISDSAKVFQKELKI